MNKYSSYKPAKAPWLGLVPEHWDERRIKTAVRRSTESNHADATVLSLYRDYGVVVKSARDDNFNRTSEDTSNYKFVEIGDLVVNKMKAWQGSIAVSGYEGIVSPAYHVYKFRDSRIIGQYVHYLLRDQSYLPEYRRLSGGIRIGQWDLSAENFMNIAILVPPVDEQEAIVAFLDEKVCQLDDTVAEIERSIELLQEYRQSVISEAVTRGLDSTVPMKDSGVKWIGKIPEHWKMQRARFTISRFRKGSGIKKDEVTSSGDIACVRYGEIYSHYSEKVSDIRSRTIEASIASPQYVSKGDLLFACTGELVEEIGKNVLFDSEEPCLVGGDVIIAEHDQHASFLNYSLGSYCAQCQKGFGKAKLKVVHISANEIGNVRMPLPPLGEQKAISDYLDEKLSEIDMLIADKQKQVGLLKEYRRSLISEAVTGKFKVPGLE